MNLIVLLKQTFDTEEKIVVENGRVSEDGVEFIINPYDEYAVEEAIQLKERNGGEVTVVTVGPDRAESALRTALAMGADRAVLIDNEGLELDPSGTAAVLAAYLKQQSFDLILCGNMSIDNGTGQVGARVAELMGIPQVTTVTRLEVDGSKVVAERDVEGDVEVVETTLPVLVSAQQGLNEPRYPSLPNIMKAKKKPLERLTLADLGLSGDSVRAKTAVVDTFLPRRREAGKILSGSLEEQAKELVRLLQTEAKVV